MKGWFQRFMAGRYGFDQFGGFLRISGAGLILSSARGCRRCCTGWGWRPSSTAIFRILSRRLPQAGTSENLKYLLPPEPRCRVVWQAAGAVQSGARTITITAAPSAASSCACPAGAARSAVFTLPEVRPSVHQRESTRDVRNMLRFTVKGLADAEMETAHPGLLLRGCARRRAAAAPRTHRTVGIRPRHGVRRDSADYSAVRHADSLFRGPLRAPPTRKNVPAPGHRTAGLTPPT